MTMQWERENRLNISVLDAQHKQLFSCLNELEQAMKNGIKSQDIEDILLRTEQYTTRHFGLEEKYMTESNFPGLEKQQLAHKFFISRLSQFVDEYKKGGLSPSVVNGLRHELTDWIKNHVTGLDMEFGIYFAQYRKEMAIASDKT